MIQTTARIFSYIMETLDRRQGNESGRAFKLASVILLSFMVQACGIEVLDEACGIEVLDGRKIVDEIKDIIQREINIVKGMIGVVVLFAIFLFVLLCKGCAKSSQTECAQLKEKTGVEQINDRLSYAPSSLIGIGSHGSSVYNGTYYRIPRAIKRFLNTHHSIVENEMKLLLSIDHPYILQYYGYERDKDFTYIASRICTCSLEKFIEVLSGCTWGSDIDERRSEFLSLLKDGFHLWEPNGEPSSTLISLIKNIVIGLHHLHECGIVHRDLKPGNVLIMIVDGDSIPKLSDVGVNKHLVGQSSGSLVIDYGSSGWRGPELILSGWGQPDACVDMFSLGCLITFCVTRGCHHPFGRLSEREAKILDNKADLSYIFDMHEAHDLVSKLIHQNQHERLDIWQILYHPFFWDSARKMKFIALVSDTIKSEGANSTLRSLVENEAAKVFNQNWANEIHVDIMKYHMSRNNIYKYSSLSDLLRLMRNSNSHFPELAKGVTTLHSIVGGTKSEDLSRYFFQAYRRLLMEVYIIICQTSLYNVAPEFQDYIAI